MRLRAVSAITVLALLSLVGEARADVFEPLALVSATALEQADYAHDPAISGNGEYVVFDGSIGGVTGVWRRDLKTREVIQVAGGDADLPSISEDGQYVSFTSNEGAALPNVTNEAIDPEPEVREAPNVYVRNMAEAPTEAGAFVVASAANGSEAPLTYSVPAAEDIERYGSSAVGRSAISADGQKVVFTTTAVSDLTDPATPGSPSTPPLQVAVRDIEEKTTELVTVKHDPATGKPEIGESGLPVPVPYTVGDHGAVYTQAGAPQFLPPPVYENTPQVGASISADGSTVAWLAQNVAEQVPALSGETPSPAYAEPLWRRIGEGESAPTRAVTGGADPLNPECEQHPEAHLPGTPSTADPCQGPFQLSEKGEGLWEPLSGVDPVPRLSADGYTVAFVVDVPLVSLGLDYGGEHHDDLYVANMHEGLTRVQALTPLTRLASGNESQIATTAPILDFDISPDARQVAFTTKRTQFPLSTPAYVTAPAAAPRLAELFDVDLTDETLTRVTHGYEGGSSVHPYAENRELSSEDPFQVPGDGALAPSFSNNGQTLAFSSTASNLVYGDGNTPPVEGAPEEHFDGSDIFTVDREIFTPVETPQIISPAPPGPTLEAGWRLWVTASSLSNGSVRLNIEAPAAGNLRADAAAELSVKARGAHRSRTALVKRTIAAAAQPVTPSAAGLATVTLKLSHNYAALARERDGFSATAAIVFTAPGHPALRQNVRVLFHRASKAARSHTRSETR